MAHERGFEAYHLRDLRKEREPDPRLRPIILNGSFCFVTKNARDFRGPDNARGSGGEYAGVDLHAGLVCIHGPSDGFRKEQQLEAFSVALDLIEAADGDPVNLLIEITWSTDGIDFEVVDFPEAPDVPPDRGFASKVLRYAAEHGEEAVGEEDA